jgi:hypothetical protein
MLKGTFHGVSLLIARTSVLWPSFGLLLACSAPSLLRAQASPSIPDIGATSASATTNDEGPAGIVPFVKGPNVSLITTSQHDSDNGWSSLLTPDLAWRFNRRFSADASTPIYDYINVLVTGGTKAKPTYTETTRKVVAGDTAINGHFDAHPSLLDYNFTATLGAPTGDKNDGLGAGQVTYNLNNHFEKDFDIFSPDIEIGFGDSSQLIGSRIQKSYTSVGKLAHFQAGSSVDLPFHTTFDAEAYEELPLSSQILYSTTGKGKKKVTTATNEGVAEDNGFTTSLDIPLNGHVTLSGFYNRSLRNHLDTAGFSFTFLLKGPPHEISR